MAYTADTPPSCFRAVTLFTFTQSKLEPTGSIVYHRYIIRNAIATVLRENAIVSYEQLAIIDPHDELVPMNDLQSSYRSNC